MRRRRRTPTPTHHKSMLGYELYAWQDAMELAQMFESKYYPDKARKLFESFCPNWLKDVEEVLEEDIIKMLGATHRGREAVLQRLDKRFTGPNFPEGPENIIIAFFIICIIVQLRVERMLRIRDYYRTIMGPGATNRSTCSRWYGFSRQMAAIPTDYEFPEHVFNAYGTGLSGQEDCDEDDDFEEADD